MSEMDSQAGRSGSLVDAAGFDEGATWHFGNPVAEQRALLAGTGLVQRGHLGVLKISGADRLALLHSLTTQYFEGLAPGAAVQSLVLSPQGHIEHGLTGIDDGEAFWAVTEPGAAEGLASFLTRMRFMMRVEVEEVTDQFEVLWAGAKVDLGEAMAWPVGFANGREVLWPRERDLPAHTPSGTWALEALRIEAGIPRIGLDTDHKTIPNEIGLWGTHLDKGCYRGQETVARVHNLGRPPRRLTRLLLDGSVDALPQVGGEVLLNGRAVGVMGSSARHHEDGPIGLALLKRGTDVAAVVMATCEDDTEVAASQEVLVDPEVGLHIRPNLR
ncbi:folate-binding protein [Aestuariimicrobium sp. p3-SID1156]|nr:folate-binding protein [Aestuariimicrobium sp. p3-SID1156]MCT1458688.1 folate-binding protein [Aestuariimicrobium sp. p3-SID1156]